MKKLTLKDATKEELIQYFFTCDYFGGGYRVQADKERFLLWLYQKRTNELKNAQEMAIETSQKALNEYIEYVGQATDEKDIDKKLAILDKANKAYERYEKAQKQYNKLDKKIVESIMN